MSTPQTTDKEKKRAKNIKNGVWPPDPAVDTTKHLNLKERP